MRRRTAPLRDFSIDGRRLALICALAAVLGVASALLAKVLLALIGIITHLAYDGTFDPRLGQPDPHRLGPLSILVPVIGALIVGVIARYGSPRVRGHGPPTRRCARRSMRWALPGRNRSRSSSRPVPGSA